MNFAIKFIKSNYTLICALALCFVIFFTISYFSIDPDFGWHLASGKYIIKNGIPTKDIFTYTAPSFTWINHEWLYDVLVAFLYGIGGYFIISLFFAGIWTSGLLLAQRKRIYYVLIFSCLAVLPFSGIRPVAWTVLFVAIIERIINAKKESLKYFLPLIFLLWANLHGSFILGLLIMTYYYFFSKNKIPVAPFILSFVAVLFNPFGLRIFEEIFRTVLDSQLKFRVIEWKAFYIPAISIPFIILTISLFLFFEKKQLKKIFGIPFFALILTLSSVRHLPIFIVTSSRYLESYLIKLKKILHSKKINNKRYFLVYCFSAGVWLMMTFFAVLLIRESISSKQTYPLKAVEYINNNPCRGNIFNSYSYGGYLIWKLPNYKVYIDGRMPSWKLNNENYLENYVKFLNDDTYRQSQVSKYNITCMLLTESESSSVRNNNTQLLDQLKREGWKLIDNASSANALLLIK